jgi:hypothetical protein
LALSNRLSDQISRLFDLIASSQPQAGLQSMGRRSARAGAAGGGAPGDAELRRLVVLCGAASGEGSARAAAAIAMQLADGGSHSLIAAVAAGAPRALARLLERADVGDVAREAGLGAVRALCDTPRGAEAFLAAGGLPPTVPCYGPRRRPSTAWP